MLLDWNEDLSNQWRQVQVVASSHIWIVGACDILRIVATALSPELFRVRIKQWTLRCALIFTHLQPFTYVYRRLLNCPVKETALVVI